MITGTHVLLYSDDPEADRAFFRDVLGFPAVDAGGGWLIFGIPSAEAALHPSSGDNRQLHGGRYLLGAVVYFMCDDLNAYIKALEGKHVRCTEVEVAPWGNKDDHPIAQRRRGRSLPTNPSDCARPQAEVSALIPS
jgi:catechol 2,3-dioxygenase-like lactoylglutathione lyase family enzyme